MTREEAYGECDELCTTHCEDKCIHAPVDLSSMTRLEQLEYLIKEFGGKEVPIANRKDLQKPVLELLKHPDKNLKCAVNYTVFGPTGCSEREKAKALWPTGTRRFFIVDYSVFDEPEGLEAWVAAESEHFPTMKGLLNAARVVFGGVTEQMLADYNPILGPSINEQMLEQLIQQTILLTKLLENK